MDISLRTSSAVMNETFIRIDRFTIWVNQSVSVGIVVWAFLYVKTLSLVLSWAAVLVHFNNDVNIFKSSWMSDTMIKMYVFISFSKNSFRTICQYNGNFSQSYILYHLVDSNSIFIAKFQKFSKVIFYLWIYTNLYRLWIVW